MYHVYNLYKVNTADHSLSFGQGWRSLVYYNVLGQLLYQVPPPSCLQTMLSNTPVLSESDLHSVK